MKLQLDMGRMLRVKPIFAAAICFVVITGCTHREPRGTPQQRYESARALFERASRDYHIPSAQLRGEERRALEQQAATLYGEVVKNYGDQPLWASQALRSLANIQASQTNMTEAVKLYAQVAERFPKQDFEVLMAWKSAADLLSDSGRQTDAKAFYERIIARFDRPDALPMVQSVVRGSKARLQGELLLTRNRD